MYLDEIKFSLWADFIERDYLDDEFKRLIDLKIINGATSNPAIFKNAILTSSAYAKQLQELSMASPKEKYEALAIYDIQKAADALLGLYNVGDDGYVSIEVDPFLCDDADATIDEGKRLYKLIDRPNVMIKIPATPAGYVAMEELVASGIAVNATLIFKKEQAIECANAFLRGSVKSHKVVNSVISVFVSRIDRALDELLVRSGVAPALSGIYNAALIYAEIQKMGVDGCRVLFASTGTKDISLPAHYYIGGLLAYNSVNTAPIETILSFHADGLKKVVLPIESAVLLEHFSKLANAGVDFEALLDKQISDGLVLFKEAFRDILEAL